MSGDKPSQADLKFVPSVRKEKLDKQKAVRHELCRYGNNIKVRILPSLILSGRVT